MIYNCTKAIDVLGINSETALAAFIGSVALQKLTNALWKWQPDTTYTLPFTKWYSWTI